MLILIGISIAFIATGNAGIITYIALVLGSTVMVVNTKRAITGANKKLDIDKMKLYQKNCEKLNGNVRKNENMTLGMSKKSKQQIAQTPADKPVFDINIIDKFALSDLKQLKENIDREFFFGFDYSQKPEETNRKKVLIPENNQDNN